MGRITLILAGFGLLTVPAMAQKPDVEAADWSAADQPAADEPTAELKALAEDCSAHKFETMVVVDGSGRAKRVKICGRDGQSASDWLVTLRDARDKVAADPDMAEPVKDQIVAALGAEIELLERSAAAPAPAASVPVAVATIDLSSEPAIVPEAVPRYSSVPPLPAPKPKSAGAPAVAGLTPIALPRLTLRCALPRESFATCTRLERETRLMVSAAGQLPGGVSLRILRGGETRAELDLGSLASGEPLREKLPGRVCAGVLRGKVEMQVVAKGQVVQRHGPFNLYCGS